MNIPEYVFYTEKLVRKKKYIKEISEHHVKFLKSHIDSRKMNSSMEIINILEYVSKKTQFEKVKDCNVWSITVQSIDSLLKFIEKNASKIEPIEKQYLYLDIAKQYSAAQAFYTLDTKEVFYITNFFEIFEKNNQTIKKPERFSKSHWRKIKIRSSIVHELFHLHMDHISNSRNELMHEKYAYSGMIDWCRDIEKLTDEEIAKFIINTYGERFPKIKISSKEELEKFGYLEGLNLIKQHDAMKN